MATEAAPKGKPVNRWALSKKIGNVGMTGASVVKAGAEHLSHTSIALLATGAAVSATGIGLLVTGACLTLAKTGMSVRSAYKSYGHRNVLQLLYARSKHYQCGAIEGDSMERNLAEHAAVVDIVLPYLIEQKDKKMYRKMVGAVPVVGIGESLRAVGKKAYKKFSGTLGVDRKIHATLLAHHLITHDCALAQAIVAELYSYDEMQWMMGQEMDVLVPLLESKMKST